MDERVVTQQAEARNIERHFDEERAGEEEAEIAPEGRGQRYERIAERVHKDDAPVAEAFGFGSADVVGGEVIE